MTIGYLTSFISTNYHCTIWEGIREICEERNVQCICFSGGELKSPEIDRFSKNIIFDFISNETIEGIIINSAIFTFVTGDTEKGIINFLKKYHNIPKVIIGVKIKDIPAILIDNSSGIRDAMIHLIKDHGYKKIAFIKGPEYNKDAELRFNTYREILAKYGIKEDPDLIEQGYFNLKAGLECFERLIQKNKKIDALVAANDEIALGALEKAQEMGMDVPGEVAIVGFDNIEKARFSIPPLTTVYQPLFEQAKMAVEMLMDLIEKGKTVSHIILPTRFIIRRSCGCFSKTIYNANTREMKIGDQAESPGLKNNYNFFINQLKNTIKNHYGSVSMDWPGRLLDSFILYIETEEKAKAFSALYMIVNQAAIKDNDDIDKWQDILSEWRKLILPFIKDDVSVLAKAESYWHQARILIQEIGTNTQTCLKITNEKRTALLRQISQELIMNFDLLQLVETMASRLPNLGIESCYLSLFEDRVQESEYSRLNLAYDKKNVNIPLKGIRFKTKELVPADLKSSEKLHGYIVDALFFEREQFGFILLKVNPREIQLEALRQQISAALKGAVLVHEVIDKENKLVALLKDQKTRAMELENAYKTLKENQERMIIMEKMASLGRMTAGIAHEMNTPLAAIRASLLELEVLINEYEQSISDPEVTASDHKEITIDMNVSLSIAQKAGERVANFLHSIKFQTRDTLPGDHQVFNAVLVIKDAILLLNHTLRNNNCSVNFRSMNDSIELYGSQGKLVQVVTNLLTNAIDAYKGKGGGPVIIELTYSADGVDLIITDKGSGIKQADLVKIFDPMFTTKSLGEGTGLGLTIVHNIVTGDYGGFIDVDSKVGEGTRFTIHFPAPPEKAKTIEKGNCKNPC